MRSRGKHAHLSADVWGVVGVAQLSGDVEAELLTVLHSGITQPDAQGAILHTTWSRKRNEETTPFGGNSIGSQVLYRTAWCTWSALNSSSLLGVPVSIAPTIG